MALKPPKPNTELAQLMVGVYGVEGLNQPAQAVQVLQVVVAARPTSAALYAVLAQYAYKANNTRIGDLAAARAVSLAPPLERVRIRNELAQVRANPNGEKTYTTTTNGKTYVLKKSSGGTFTGREVKTETAPAVPTTPCLLYTSPSPRDRTRSRMPSSA